MKTIFYLLLQLLISLTHAQLKGKVVAIADGDSFTLLDSSKKQIKVRLHGIDAPELKQDFGNVARKRISELIFGKHVLLQTTGKDRYGRTLAIVFHEHKNINEILLSEGLAWHYKKYDQNLGWALIEQKAKEKKLGLWKDENAIEPWNFRITKIYNSTNF